MVAITNFFKLGAQSLGNHMALVTAVLLVHQVDLQVSLLGFGAQVILAHKPIEGDGRRRAGIGLQVQHFRLLRQKCAQVMQRSGGVFQWGASWHFNHHLELALVVKRQHFQHHPLHQRQAHRNHQRHQNPQQQQPALFGTVQEWCQHPREQALQFGAKPFGLSVSELGGISVAMFLHHLECQPGRHGEGNEQRNRHAQAGIDRDRAHVRAHQTAHKGHRQQRGNDSERGQNGRAAHFINCGGNDLWQAALGKEFLMAVNVFHHHNGIVHQNTNRENQGKQGHPVQRKTPGPGGKQGGGQRQNDGGAHNHRLTPTQRKSHQQNHRTCGEPQFLDQLVGFFCGGFTIVTGDGGLDIGWNDSIVQFLDACPDRARHIDRIGARFFGDRQGQRRVHTARTHTLFSSGRRRGCPRRVPDVAQRQLRTGLDPSHFSQIHRQALADTHHQVTHILS